jgi:dolichol-phosphate mannosyltransferase
VPPPGQVDGAWEGGPARKRDAPLEDPTSASIGPELSVVVPTLNEAKNLEHLCRRIARALRGSVSYEVIVVDDASTDGTADLAESLSSRLPVRVLRRPAKFGLANAVLDGFKAAKGRFLAVMDADLQHDPAILPKLVLALGENEIAVGSRYAFQGKTCGWSILREAESRLAAFVTRQALTLTVSDPLSGYFAIRRSTFEGIDVPRDVRGWKILLELLARAPDASVAEVPFTFRSRKRGKTKMNPWVAAVWLAQLRDLRAAQRATRRAIQAEVVPS